MMAPARGKNRLLRLVMPFVAVVIFQAFLAGLSLEMLSSVRAYVGGEGLWSKGQKDAIHFISLYSETGDERFFDQFKKAIAIPLSDRAARYALEQRPPDLDARKRHAAECTLMLEIKSVALKTTALLVPRSSVSRAHANPLPSIMGK